ncbi:MarR family winged helix-turn-helix transcriptional regulator [Halococcus hamelinensis]|uniref:MarR family transcriptional regulator n=1 Tax=Halococcus hamelinensis 100A6 TaxID=1132509 RepID=M0M3U6_9EURY|nr:MarR family transcriptional regulator [Halococcus hamelinensis]EMA39020.1 MarR family transcriptional regulator [Halococcus hamelinensis 100A6]
MHPAVFALKRAHQATRNRLDERLARYDLTAAQTDVLVALYYRSEVEQHALAETLGVSGPTLARILDAVEERGLVTRTESPTDARINLVSLSERGTTVVRDLTEAEGEAFTEAFLDGFSHTDVADLVRMLDRIAENMGDTSQNIYR